MCTSMNFFHCQTSGTHYWHSQGVVFSEFYVAVYKTRSEHIIVWESFSLLTDVMRVILIAQDKYKTWKGGKHIFSSFLNPKPPNKSRSRKADNGGILLGMPTHRWLSECCVSENILSLALLTTIRLFKDAHQ